MKFTIFRGLSLRKKLFFSYLFMVIIPIFIILISIAGWLKTDFQEKLSHQIDVFLNQTELYINNLTKQVETEGVLLFNNEELRELLSVTTERNELYEQVEDYNKIEELLLPFRIPYHIHTIRLVVDPDLLFARIHSIFLELDDFILNFPFYNEVKDKYQVGFWTPRYRGVPYDGENDSVISYIIEFRDPDDLSRHIGYGIFEILEKDFKAIVQDVNIFNGDTMIIIDDKGRIVTGSHDFNDLLPSIPSHWYSSEEEKKGILNIQGKQFLWTKKRINSPDWTAIYMYPIIELTKAHNAQLIKIIIIGAASALLLLLSATIIARRITLRINRLATQMHRVESQADISNSTKAELLASGDEIDRLEYDYHLMMNRITSLVDSNKEIVSQKSRAEVELLQAQINPHFLYNILDSINWIALDSGAEDVSSIITKLGKFYRLSLARGSFTVPLKNEIEHVKTYIDLQNIRFENSVRYTFEIPEEMNDTPIVKITLQPLIENSINHGILKSPDKKGCILIKGRTSRKKAYIEITNTGPPGDPYYLNSILLNSHTDKNKKQSFGIKNVDERLKLAFGKDCGLHYDRSADGNTVCRVIFGHKKEDGFSNSLENSLQ